MIGRRHFLRDLVKACGAEVEITRTVCLVDDTVLEEGTTLDEIEIGLLPDDFLLEQSGLPIKSVSNLSRSWLTTYFNDTIEKHPAIAELHEKKNLAPILKKCLNAVRWISETILHIECMHKRQPRLLENAALGSWVAILLSNEREIPEEVIISIFLGSFFRDFGMLYMDQEWKHKLKRGELTYQETLAMQTHVEFTQDYLFRIGRVPPEAIEASHLHHIKANKSGFPKKARTLKPPPHIAIVSFADDVAHLLCPLEEEGIAVDLPFVPPCLLLDYAAYEPQTFANFAQLCTEVSVEVEPSFEVINELVNDAKQLDIDYKALIGDLDQPKLIKKRLSRTTAWRRANRILTAMRRSGHGDPELSWWMGLVQAGKDSIESAELGEFRAQQRLLLHDVAEVRRHVSNVVRQPD